MVKMDERLLESTPSCTICLTAFHQGEEIAELHCQHRYHRHCITTWLVNHQSTCPICRQNVDPAEWPAHGEEEGGDGSDWNRTDINDVD